MIVVTGNSDRKVEDNPISRIAAIKSFIFLCWSQNGDCWECGEDYDKTKQFLVKKFQIQTPKVDPN